MQTLRSILVGLDFDDGDGGLSEGSRAAAQQALWLAGRTGASVEFLHSTAKNPEDGACPFPTPNAMGRTDLESLLAEHGREGLELHLAADPPWVAITRRILSGSNDLVVVAKRNHARREDRRIGSVSLKLIRKCPAPVWVVKPGHELRHRCIVAATDLTPVGDLATEYAAFLAAAEGCDLHVVHAWQMPMELQLSSGRISDAELAERRDAILDAARSRIEGIAGVAGLGPRAHVVLARDTPSHAVLAVVERHDPDLVVLGTISRGGLPGFLVGNTCERLIYSLPCSLLTVKPADFPCPLE